MKSKDLEDIALTIRKDVLEMVNKAGSGHIAGPLGMADVFAFLYFEFLKVDPKNPSYKKRDYFFLSNGHICPALYSVLSLKEFISRDELKSLRKLGSALQGHPHRTEVSGVESSSGPLGSGLSQAAGAACGLRIDKYKSRVVCMTSDGEHQEGNTWEAIMFAGKERLSNLINIVDYNNIQIDGFVSDIMPLNNLKDAYVSFGWDAEYVDAHDFKALRSVFSKANSSDKPFVIIAKSVAGKGVSFIEKDYKWHGKAPSDVELTKALEELK